LSLLELAVLYELQQHLGPCLALRAHFLYRLQLLACVLTESRRLIKLVDEISRRKRIGISLLDFRSAYELVGEFQSARWQLVTAYQMTASSAELGIGRSPAVSTLVEPIDCIARLLRS